MLNSISKKYLVKYLFGVIIILICFGSCKKNIHENNANIFNQSEAREWYYGTFKKSKEWSQSNDKGNKIPDWENGTYRKVGNIEIVEFPLLKRKNIFSIPNTKNISLKDIRIINDGSLARISFIKSTNNEIFVRELDYIPDLTYLKSKGYDISGSKIGSKLFDFSGRIITKMWNGTILSIQKLSNGNITKSGKIKRSSIQFNVSSISNTSIQSSDCELLEICEYERICEEIRIGDIWVKTDQCSPWEPTGNCWIEEYCGSANCNYDSSEACDCQLYNIGCVGGLDSQNFPSDPCDVSTRAANATTNLSKDNTFISAKTSITSASRNVEHTITFGKDANGNISASSMITCASQFSCNVNLNYPGAFADLHNHPNDQPPSQGDMYNLITINNNYIGYNTRLVVTLNESVYALVIMDLNKANTFKTKYPSIDNGFGPDFPDEINDAFIDAKINAQSKGYENLIAEEMAMAFVLDKYETGISIFKQNNNGNFKRLKTDKSTANGTIIYTANNCQ